MPVARFQMPDGRVARFEVPEGTSPEQAQALIQKQIGAPQEKAAPKPGFARGVKDSAVNTLAGLAQGAASLPDIPFMIGEAGNKGFRNVVDAGLRLFGAEGAADRLARGQEALDRNRFTTIGNQIERAFPTKEGFGLSRFASQFAGGLMAGGPKLSPPPVGFDALAPKVATKGVQKASRIAQAAIAKRLNADGIRPDQAGQMMDDAAARGVPLSLMDVGDNMRGLGGYLSRTSGPSKTLIRNALKTRQAGAGERIRGAVSRDLGPISNTFDESDGLIQAARATAAPLYDEAYKAPGAASSEIADILKTPAGKGALSRAYTIAKNERVDPTSLGFDLDAQGEVILNRVPNMRSLDYVKRGLDDILEAQRDPFGNLRLDESGRAINKVRADLLTEMDKVNPTYQAAREAYAGPAAANEALWKGKKAISKTAEEIERTVAKMSEFERGQYASGFRASMAEAIDKSGGSADVANKMLGTSAKRKALAKVFGGEKGLTSFLAGRQMDDIAGSGDLISNPLVAAAGNAAIGRPRSAITNLIEAGRGRIEFGANKTADEARNQAAALLSEVNPNAIRKIMAESIRQNTLRIARENRNARVGLASGVAGVNSSR